MTEVVCEMIFPRPTALREDGQGGLPQGCIYYTHGRLCRGGAVEGGQSGREVGRQTGSGEKEKAEARRTGGQ